MLVLVFSLSANTVRLGINLIVFEIDSHFWRTNLDIVSPYQSFAGTDGRGPLHSTGLHGAEEVAGVVPRTTGLSPHGASVPRLQDVVAGKQVIVSSQTER